MTTLIPKFDLKDGGATPTGAINRTIFEKLSDTISVKDFGAVGDGTTNDTVSLQAALDYAVANTCVLTFPPGVYKTTAELLVSSGQYLTIKGINSSFDGINNATISYAGAVDPTKAVLKIDSLSRVSIEGIQLYAASKAGAAFICLPDTAGKYAAYGWTFKNVTFAGATSSGFYIGGTSNGARFNFTSCSFYTNKYGFYTTNQNALNHNFQSCSFDNAINTVDSVGIYMGAGSFSATSCEFSGNYTDVYLAVIGSCSMIGCYTEQSRQFVYTTNATGGSLSLINCICSSFPWAWWKQAEGTRTQPANDVSQWAAISWDRQTSSLTMTGCQFIDPYNGGTTGSIAPTSITGNQVCVLVRNGVSAPVNMNNFGSYFQNGVNSFTAFNLNIPYGTGGSYLYQRTARMNYVYGSAPGQDISGAISLSNIPASVYYFNPSGSATITPATSLVQIGDRSTYIFTQKNASANTITFNSSLVSGGTSGVFSPTTGTNAVSSITFEFTGNATYPWVETGRALNLQHV